MSDIFLSYAREDRDFAEPLAKALEDFGWSVWWDRRLEAGEVWDEVISNNIEVAKIVLVLWSPTSVNSRRVKNEARFADEKGKLVPLLVRSTPIPLEFRHRQTEDLTAWRGDPRHAAFRRLAETLAARLGSGNGPPPNGRDGRRLWLLSAVLLGLAGLGGGFLALTGGDDRTGGSDKLTSGQPGAAKRVVVAVPGGKTLAEWTPGCLYEVRAEKQADGALRTCFGFDPNECFNADGVTQPPIGSDKLKSGAPVFASLSPARDRWAAGTLSATSGDRYYVQLDSGLECAKGDKPGLWVGADAVIASIEDFKSR